MRRPIHVRPGRWASYPGSWSRPGPALARPGLRRRRASPADLSVSPLSSPRGPGRAVRLPHHGRPLPLAPSDPQAASGALPTRTRLHPSRRACSAPFKALGGVRTARRTSGPLRRSRTMAPLTRPACRLRPRGASPAQQVGERGARRPRPPVAGRRGRCRSFFFQFPGWPAYNQPRPGADAARAAASAGPVPWSLGGA